jgi:hypothetical protein
MVNSLFTTPRFLAIFHNAAQLGTVHLSLHLDRRAWRHENSAGLLFLRCGDQRQDEQQLEKFIPKLNAR